jgi:hypothetical protein
MRRWGLLVAGIAGLTARAAATRGVVTNSRTTNDHLLFTTF